MSDGHIVTLEPWEFEHGFNVGIRRFTSNWCRGDAPHYHREFMEEDRKAQAAAALCELAVAKYLNQYWHGSIWHVSEQGKYREMADVGTNIEVRRVRTQGGITVRVGDAGKVVWGARTADPEYRTIELLGYVEADRALKLCRDRYVVVPFTTLIKPWLKTRLPESNESGVRNVSGWEPTGRSPTKSTKGPYPDGKQSAIGSQNGHQPAGEPRRRMRVDD